jgi:spermidine synthase
VILNGSKFFEWPTDEKFKLVNADALAYVYNLTEEVKFDFIIIDVSNNEEKDQNYPPLQFSEENYIEKCLSFLNEGGLIIYNTIRL